MVEGRRPLLPVCPKVRPGESEAQTLRSMAVEGLADRLTAMEVEGGPYRDRLDYELGVIEAMGFSGYFLIVADFIQWAKKQGIAVGPGRGSGAGSVAAWALTITDIDPLRFGLLFERFLNPDRISMPDFDIDFCQERRDEVIGYVRREYGADRVAQIITFGKLQARAAIRDVGRVLQLPYGLVMRVAELIPNNPAKPVTLAQAVAGEERLRQMRDSDEGVRRLLEIALQLEGLYRHASTHAAGVVIGDRPLVELVPLYRDPKTDGLVTQFNMKFVEQAGLVKFDFLGLTTLTILERAVGFLEKTGLTIDLARIPLDDARTYAMLSRGDTGGVFQFEGAGMRDVLRQMRPDRLEDLTAAVALYRPGPMANIPDYCARKHGAGWAAPHPEIHAILEETYGIMVYQEQVMQIAQTMAGYSLGAADLLRRAMGKKIRAEMDTQRAIFTDGAVGRGVPQAKAVEVFDLMAKFADYGFNKSHAAAYALVSYQTAWLKANHPTSFLAACLSLAINNTDKLAALRQEIGRLGIALLPPDINRSEADFSVEVGPDGKEAIRYALAAVKRVGLEAMKSLCASRGLRPFADISDFAARVDPAPLNRMQLESLVRAGAFDCLETNRARLLAGIETVLKRAQSNSEEAASGQIGLFMGNPEAQVVRLPDLADWPDVERLGHEADAIGFHLTAHPLDAYRGLLRRLGTTGTADIETEARAGQTRLRIAGCVVDRKERPTRTGGKMAWLRVSDPAGMAEVTLFSEVLARRRDILTAGRAVLVTADIKIEGEAIRITAADVVDLEHVAAEAAGGAIRVWVDRIDALEPIRQVLSRGPKGRGSIILVPSVDAARRVEIVLPETCAVTPRLAQALKSLPGVARVEET
jgi:DNA polymerase-3 subunit alpha